MGTAEHTGPLVLLADTAVSARGSKWIQHRQVLES